MNVINNAEPLRNLSFDVSFNSYTGDRSKLQQLILPNFMGEGCSFSKVVVSQRDNKLYGIKFRFNLIASNESYTDVNDVRTALNRLTTFIIACDLLVASDVEVINCKVKYNLYTYESLCGILQHSKYIERLAVIGININGFNNKQLTVSVPLKAIINMAA